jgi:hypothetical protein
MRIRSITSFYDPALSSAEKDLSCISQISNNLVQALTAAGLTVQSTRLAATPFPTWLSGLPQSQTIQRAKDAEAAAQQMGWTYFSLGPALPEYPSCYDLIPAILAETQNVFLGAVMADNKVIYPQAVSLCAEVIHRNAAITSDGFANLRFSALANVPPETPFLPSAYHQPGEPPAISIAVECADVVIDSFKNSVDLEESRNRLLSSLETAAAKIGRIVNEVISGSGIVFKGFDFSPAPYPEDWCSLGGGVELLGLEHIGAAGSLAAVAVIADTLDKGNWLRAGFNGMMLPVLEDSVLARRAAEGSLTVKDLLLYSAVCGTGLDTVPLSGNTTREQLTGILMDVAALAVRLAKPLTARLMPIPGKTTGEKTNFKFDYFANSRVMALDGQTLSTPLSISPSISLTPRRH